MWWRLFLSEYLLSLYPSLVKFIKQPIHIQMWGRLLVFSFISLFFGSGIFNVFKNLLNPYVVILSLVNVIHIYTSYLGFKNLDPADAYSIFYIYPFTNLIMLWLAGLHDINPLQWLAFGTSIIGILLLKANSWFKVIMGISAITESLIYFILKTLNFNNSWDNVFYTYFIPAVILTSLYIKEWYKLEIPILINGVIGAVGYYLRFWNVNTVEPITYSLASYFGIPFSYFNQFFINNISISPNIFGTTLIILGLMLGLYFKS